MLSLLQVWRGWRGWRSQEGPELWSTVPEHHRPCPHTLWGWARGVAGPARLPLGQWLAGGRDRAGEGLVKGGGWTRGQAVRGTGSDRSEHRHHQSSGEKWRKYSMCDLTSVPSWCETTYTVKNVCESVCMHCNYSNNLWIFNIIKIWSMIHLL